MKSNTRTWHYKSSSPQLAPPPTSKNKDGFCSRFSLFTKVVCVSAAATLVAASLYSKVS